MNNYFALVVSVLCLYQTTRKLTPFFIPMEFKFDLSPFFSTVAAVYNAKLMQLDINDAKTKNSQQDTKPEALQNMTMAAFARSAAQVLEPLPFITRDSIASLILMTDGVFGNMTGIAAVVSQVLNMANLVLSSFPFGALLPILVQVVLNILMAPQTRYFAKYLLYRVWLLFPASNNDRYTVQVSDGDVIVTSTSDTFPSQIPFQPTLPPMPQFLVNRK